MAIRYLVKMTAPCECCNNLSYGFKGTFETEEDARQWIVQAKYLKITNQKYYQLLFAKK